MPPDASPSGLLADEGFRARLRQHGANVENVIAYKGSIRKVLEAKAANARRQGIAVDFVQAYLHGKLARFVLVHDPSLPGRLQKQALLVGATDTWDDALMRAGLLSGGRQRTIPPTAYIECPDCRDWALKNLACPTCHGKGLVPSSDDS